MTRLQQTMTRRTFLKVSALLSALPVNFDDTRGIALTTPWRQAGAVGYGMGAYGADRYPGFTTNYLPLVHRRDE